MMRETEGKDKRCRKRIECVREKKTGGVVGDGDGETSVGQIKREFAVAEVTHVICL